MKLKKLKTTLTPKPLKLTVGVEDSDALVGVSFKALDFALTINSLSETALQLHVGDLRVTDARTNSRGLSLIHI